jgi:hypothetical protein
VSAPRVPEDILLRTVADAITRCRADGVAPTISSIRNRGGRGADSRIQELIREWEAGEPSSGPRRRAPASREALGPCWQDIAVYWAAWVRRRRKKKPGPHARAEVSSVAE